MRKGIAEPQSLSYNIVNTRGDRVANTPSNQERWIDRDCRKEYLVSSALARRVDGKDYAT
jgi:hypothetical protein